MNKRTTLIFALVVVGAVALGLLYWYMPGRMTRQQMLEAAKAREQLERAPDNVVEAATVDDEETTQTMESEDITVAEASGFRKLDTPPKGEDGGIPDVFYVYYACSNGDFVAEYHKDWAPLGAERVYEIVKEGVHEGARFFRVVPGFVVQWGIPGDPQVAAKWRNKNIKDDPVIETNAPGTITFACAGPNSRSSQMFINFGDNARLDNYSQGFPPLGKVVYGMDVVTGIESKYREAPNQGMIQEMGNDYLDAQFPGLDYIKGTVFVEPAEQEASAEEPTSEATQEPAQE